MDNFCELTAFMNWWFAANKPINIPLNDAVCLHYEDKDDRSSEKVTCINLYRHGAYQVQLVVVPPNSAIRQHIHPNMDSYEVYNSGSLVLDVDGVIYGPEPAPPVRILPTSWHGSPKGAGLSLTGGSFFSVQNWLNGHLPTCAGCDWLGDDGGTLGHSITDINKLRN
jgi:hypothetical protein